MSRTLFLATLLVLVALSPAEAQSNRRCLVEFERALTRDGVSIEQFPGNTNYYAGGNVRLRCIGQNVRLGGDSLESISGDYLRLVKQAYYRDADFAITADTLTYYKNGERIEARGSVVVTNTKDSSSLRGPHLDYFRQVRGVRDSAETRAMMRPTLRVVPAPTEGDSAAGAPYTVVADMLHGFGSSTMIGRGNVTVERDSLRGVGDSLHYTTGAEGKSVLLGHPAQWARTGSDSFTVRGREIRLGLNDELLDDLRAYGDGIVLREGSRISGDSVALRFAGGKLSRTDAWGKNSPASVLRDGYDIVGDSIAIETPEEVLTRLQVYGNGMVRNPLDSTEAPSPAPVDSTAPVRERDTLWGNRIDATFAQVDSSGTLLTRLTRIEAIGSARSLIAQTVERNGTTTPTLNYSRADTIIIVMKAYPGDGFAEVTMHGNVDGVQLETASVGRVIARPKAGGAP